jgi:hypothetical protein
MKLFLFQVIVHYVLCLLSCTWSGLAVGFGINGLVYCLSYVPKLFRMCTPYHEGKMAFVGTDIALNALLLPVAIVGEGLSLVWWLACSIVRLCVH